MKLSVLIFAVLAVGITVALAGCGGGEGGDASLSTESPPTRAEFVKKANAACGRARAGLEEREREFEQRSAGRALAPGVDMVHFVFLPTIEAQVKLLQGLKVPQGDEERVDAILDAERFTIDALAVMPKVPSVAWAERHFAKADRLLRAYGLDACTNRRG